MHLVITHCPMCYDYNISKILSLQKARKPAVSETFEKLYTPLLKAVFHTKAQEMLSAGADGLSTARAYAEQGKPEFVLAFLLQIDLPGDEKRQLFAHAYERRAILSEQKAEQLNLQFHRPFPLIKLEAQKDRLIARSIREGKPVRSTTKIPPIT
jgi:hypothetical protein